METQNVDVIVIGAGSGLQTITDGLKGKTVLVAENRRYGGTCLNYGCIPSKMLARTAYLARSPEEGQRLNVDLSLGRIEWPVVRERIFSRIDHYAASGQDRYESQENVTWLSEQVRLDGPKSIVTEDGRRFEADQIVFAAGSRPTVLDMPGVDLPGVYTSDNVMRIDEFPKRLVIIGSGSVGCEFASIFSGLGASVTQLIRGETLMKKMGDEIAEKYTKEAAERWVVEKNQDLLRIEPDASGLRVITGEGAHEADAVLLAVGRTPNTDRLALAEFGYDVDEKGILQVDKYMRALVEGKPVSGAYALGDMAPGPHLKHVANYEAQVVGWNLAHPTDLSGADGRPVAYATFTTPELASVGITEEQARQQYGKDELVTAQSFYEDTAFGYAMEATTGLVKLVGNKSTGLLLGAQIMGEDAANLLQALTPVITFQIRARAAAHDQYWVHPALVEVVRDGLWSLAEKMEQ